MKRGPFSIAALASLTSITSLCLLASCRASPSPLATPQRPAAAGASSAALAEADTGEVAPPAELPGGAATDKMVAAMLVRVVAARSLSADRPVPSKTLDRPELLAQVRAQMDRDVPREAVRGQGELLIALGLIPPDYDFEKGVYDLLEAQLAGYYEPADKTMYLARDLSIAAAEETLAHELVHALQDQHWDLGPKIRYQQDGGDVSGAIHAMAEGDAMSGMLDVTLAAKNRTALDLGDSLVIEGIKVAVMTGESTSRIPPVLKSSLVVAYTDGLRFIHGLRRRGGWAEVNRAWKSPPVTTEQLLHLDKYDAKEPALAVPAPRTDALGGGFRVLFSDLFGEQSVRIAFEEWGSEKRAAAAAAGWGGDRVAVLLRTKGDVEERMVTWWIRYDGSPKSCSEADEAFAFVAHALTPSPTPASGPIPGRTGTVCRERRDLGPLVVARSGCDILLVAGPYAKVGEAFVPRSSCAPVSEWASKAVRAP